MDLSVITVTWNSERFIGDQIRSVTNACEKISCEEIVIDNASEDGTVRLIEERFPGVRLIKNSENLGFARANNKGVAEATGEFLLFLNPDMRCMPDSLDAMVAWMKAHPKVGIAGCKLTDDAGTLLEHAKPRRFPTLFDEFAIIFKLPHFFPHIIDHHLMRDFDASKDQEVDTVRGAFMLMRKDMIEKLGFAFDPRYFIWFEDVDICREAKRLGYTVMYTPVISAVDYIGQSFKKRRTSWKQQHFFKSMAQYFEKWEPWYKSLPIRVMTLLVTTAAKILAKIEARNA